MLTKTELGLTDAQYALLQQPQGLNGAYRVTAYPSHILTPHEVATPAWYYVNDDVTQNNFVPLRAFIDHANEMWIYYVDDTKPRMVRATSPSTVGTRYDRDGMIYDSGEQVTYAFQLGGTRFRHAGGTVTSEAMAGILGSVCAPVTKNVVYYFEESGTKFNFELKRQTKESGSWVVQQSDIWIPGFGHNLPGGPAAGTPGLFWADAVRLSDGTDIVTWKALLPGPLEDKLDASGNPIQYISRRSLIMAVTCKDGVWGEPVEVYEILNPTPRRYLRGWNINLMGDLAVITFIHGIDETNGVFAPLQQDFYVLAIATKDGLNWSQVERTDTFQVPDTPQFPANPSRDSCVVGVFNGRPHQLHWAVDHAAAPRFQARFWPLVKTPYCYGFDGCDPGADITAAVQAINISKERIGQAGLEINNDLAGIIGDDDEVDKARMLLRIELGYYPDEVSDPVLIPAIYGEIDRVSRPLSAETPDVITVSLRDQFSFLTDKIEVKRSVDMSGHLVDLEDFRAVDPAFGPLAKVSVVSGSWQWYTPDYIGHQTADGFARITMGANEWNGVIEGGTYVSAVNGIGSWFLSRYVSGSNGISIGRQYLTSLNSWRLEINYWRKGVGQTVTLTESASAAQRHIRGRVRYGKIYAEVSTDTAGLTWNTTGISHVIDYGAIKTTWYEFNDTCGIGDGPHPPGWGLYHSINCFFKERMKYNSHHPPMTLFDGIRRLAAFGGLHDVKERRLIDLPAHAYSTSGIVKTASDNGADNRIAHKWPQNFVIAFDLPGNAGGAILRFMNDTQTLPGPVTVGGQYVEAKQEADGRFAIAYTKDVAGTPTATTIARTRATYALTGRVVVCMRTHALGMPDVSTWYSVSIWHNNQFVLTGGFRKLDAHKDAASEWRGSELRYEDIKIYALTSTGDSAIGNVVMTELTEPLEGIAMDPGDNPYMALQRVSEGYYPEMFIRATGELYALRRTTPRDYVDLSGIAEDGEKARDYYGAYSLHRYQGNYLELEGRSATPPHRDRFSVLDVSRLADPNEGYLSALRALDEARRTQRTASFNIPWHPLIEPFVDGVKEEHLSWDGRAWSVEGYNLNTISGNIEQAISLLPPIHEDET